MDEEVVGQAHLGEPRVPCRVALGLGGITQAPVGGEAERQERGCYLALYTCSFDIQTIFLGSKVTADGDCRQEIKRCLLLGRKVTTNLDSILKSRDVTLPTKVRIVKALVFPVVVYGCES